MHGRSATLRHAGALCMKPALQSMQCQPHTWCGWCCRNCTAKHSEQVTMCEIEQVNCTSPD